MTVQFPFRSRIASSQRTVLDSGHRRMREFTFLFHLSLKDRRRRRRRSDLGRGPRNVIRAGEGALAYDLHQNFDILKFLLPLLELLHNLLHLSSACPLPPLSSYVICGSPLE